MEQIEREGGGGYGGKREGGEKYSWRKLILYNRNHQNKDVESVKIESC
jgi:hypothetical protein